MDTTSEQIWGQTGYKRSATVHDQSKNQSVSSRHCNSQTIFAISSQYRNFSNTHTQLSQYEGHYHGLLLRCSRLEREHSRGQDCSSPEPGSSLPGSGHTPLLRGCGRRPCWSHLRASYVPATCQLIGMKTQKLTCSSIASPAPKSISAFEKTCAKTGLGANCCTLDVVSSVVFHVRLSRGLMIAPGRCRCCLHCRLSQISGCTQSWMLSEAKHGILEWKEQFRTVAAETTIVISYVPMYELIVVPPILMRSGSSQRVSRDHKLILFRATETQAKALRL